MVPLRRKRRSILRQAGIHLEYLAGRNATLETSGIKYTHDKQGYSRQLPQSQRDHRSNVSSVLFLDANAKESAIDAIVKGNRYQLE